MLVDAWQILLNWRIQVKVGRRCLLVVFLWRLVLLYADELLERVLLVVFILNYPRHLGLVGRAAEPWSWLVSWRRLDVGRRCHQWLGSLRALLRFWMIYETIVLIPNVHIKRLQLEFLTVLASDTSSHIQTVPNVLHFLIIEPIISISRHQDARHVRIHSWALVKAYRGKILLLLKVVLYNKALLSSFQSIAKWNVLDAGAHV